MFPYWKVYNNLLYEHSKCGIVFKLTKLYQILLVFVFSYARANPWSTENMDLKVQINYSRQVLLKVQCRYAESARCLRLEAIVFTFEQDICINNRQCCQLYDEQIFLILDIAFRAMEVHNAGEVWGDL